MKKIVKKYGNTLIVQFNVDDCRIHRIVEGSVIDLSEMKVLDIFTSKMAQADLDIIKICKDLHGEDS